MSKKESRGLSAAELSAFCGQVALILEAGLPLYDGMETLSEAERGSEHGGMYEAASRGVTETGSLYEALKADGSWPDYLVEMTGIGERSGQLERVMRGLEEYYAREDRIRSAVSGAVAYPLALGAMLAVIVLILLLRVLPVFRRVLASMGGGLTDSGSMLMSMGAAAGWIVLVLTALAAVAVIAAAVMMRTGRREKVLSFARRAFPPLADVSRRMSASRVGSVLSMMLSGGFPMDEALEMTGHVLSDRQAASAVERIRRDLNEGQTFADAVGRAGLFDDLHCRMIRMGAGTGREDQVLGKLARLYEEQTEEGVARLVSIIEPTLVALLTVVIGAVLLSVMLPMAGILSSL